MYNLKSLICAFACCLISVCAVAQDMSENTAGGSNTSVNTTLNTTKYVKTMPGFIGSLPKFLEKNLQYPQEAIERHQEGRALMLFTIMENGIISDISIKEGSGFYLLDNEAMRVTQLMSSKAYWKPATQNGKPVRSLHTMPITFELQ